MSRRSKPRQDPYRKRDRNREGQVQHRPDTAMYRAPIAKVQTAGHCPTGKHRYATEVDALIVLSNTQSKDSTRRAKVEKRVYPCDDCIRNGKPGWHTTSRMQYRPPKPE